MSAFLPRAKDIRHVPVRWPDTMRQRLENIIRSPEGSVPEDELLISKSLAKADNGDVEGAELDALSALKLHERRTDTNNSDFIAIVNALFVVQRLDIVSGLIQNRYAPGIELEIRIEENGPGVGRQRWEIDETGRNYITFDANIFRQGSEFHGLRHFCWEAPLLFNYALSAAYESGSVILNQWDVGLSPGLCYCDSRPNFYLIPDYIFVPTKGYRDARVHFDQNAVPWSQRSSVAFWRGATTGICQSRDQWHTLERIRLCEIARKCAGLGIFDVGISSIAQFNDPSIISEIKSSGLVRGSVPWMHWNKFKYLIDIDGNSSPWSNLFQRLLTGSAVLKVESSRGLRQWFYDDLIPWKNYVPVAPDISDLVDKVNWLIRHDTIAEKIGQAGRELAIGLSYETELARSVPVISAAFCDARQDSHEISQLTSNPTIENTKRLNNNRKISDREATEICKVLQLVGFDKDRYLKDNADLSIFRDDLPELVAHFMHHGAAEGRKMVVPDLNLLREEIAKTELPADSRAILSSLEQSSTGVNLRGFHDAGEI